MLGTALQTKVTPIVKGYGGWAWRMEIVPIESAYPGFGELIVSVIWKLFFHFYFIPFKMVDEFIGFYDFWKGWGWFYQTIAYFMTTYLEAQMLLFSLKFPSSSLFQRPKHAVTMLYVLDFCRILRLTLLSRTLKQVLESTDHINSCKPVCRTDPSNTETLKFLQKLKTRYS